MLIVNPYIYSVTGLQILRSGCDTLVQRVIYKIMYTYIKFFVLVVVIQSCQDVNSLEKFNNDNVKTNKHASNNDVIISIRNDTMFIEKKHEFSNCLAQIAIVDLNNLNCKMHYVKRKCGDLEFRSNISSIVDSIYLDKADTVFKVKLELYEKELEIGQNHISKIRWYLITKNGKILHAKSENDSVADYLVWPF
jgi:hypothetical protein